MKPKKYTTGVTFFTTRGMYEQIRSMSENRQVSQAEILREAVTRYFADQKHETLKA